MAGRYMRAVAADGALAHKAASKARKAAKRKRKPLAAFRCFESPGEPPPKVWGCVANVRLSSPPLLQASCAVSCALCAGRGKGGGGGGGGGPGCPQRDDVVKVAS